VRKRLELLDKNSENFLLIDHIALAPSEDLPCFGFDVLLNNSAFFVSERKYTLRECEDFLGEFIRLSGEIESYSIIETGHREFKIRFSAGRGILLSRSYYASASEAQEQLDYFTGRISETAPLHTISTKYEKLYVNLSNPFSGVVSLFLPSWPSRFQNEGFKKYIQEYFCEELPAHLAVNLKWLNFGEMSKIEKHWDEYRQTFASPDASRRMAALDRFLEVLISN
jgi:hypothetical protein